MYKRPAQVIDDVSAIYAAYDTAQSTAIDPAGPSADLATHSTTLDAAEQAAQRRSKQRPDVIPVHPTLHSNITLSLIPCFTRRPTYACNIRISADYQ